MRPSLDLNKRTKALNSEIRNHFHSQKRNYVRRNITPGSLKSIWDAVNTAKDITVPPLPDAMKLNGQIVNEHERYECFASFFENKARAHVV